MTKLKGILLTQGMHGMISQVEGLAKALNIEFIHEKIELNGFWKMIPPRFTPVKKFVFKNNIEKNFDIVISCGRKSIIPSIYLKKKYKNKIINIHIQDPKVSPKNFDFIVAPEHDGLDGANILKSKGAIHYLREDELENNKNYFGKNQIIVPNVDKKAYLSSLKLADHIVVTCDSTSMISEAAITGKPIYIAQMPPIKRNYRFKKFFELFKSLNIVKDLENSVVEWNYKKLNETDRISSYIKEKLKNYDFS